MKLVKTIVFCGLLLAASLNFAAAQQAVSSPADVSQTAKQIDAFLENEANSGFSGAVLAAKNNQIILNKTYGGVSKSGAKPVFWIASMSKSFVAAAILKLQEQGKLSVSDSIARFFQKVPADKEPITVHHLLAHTSGLPHKYVADGIGEREKAWRAILELPLERKIGKGYLYSNDGYNLLAMIVEIAAERPFEEYLRDEILKPARLKNTGFWGYENKVRLAPVANPENVPETAPTVYRNGKSVANWGYRGATGIYSTTEDLFRWMQTLRNDTVLDARSREQLWGRQILTNQIAPADEAFYGYGWRVRFKDGKRLYARHGGVEDWLGHNGLMHLSENGDAYIVLSNSGAKGDSAWSSVVSRELQKRLQQ